MSDIAPDIITYVGMPLAVLGVLPILYNVVKTSITYFKVKRRLSLASKHDEEICIGNDYFGGEIEVDLPRFRVAPLKREDPRYWALSGWDILPRGSWEMFNWNRLPSGKRTQRLKSANQLRQLQAEVTFEELIAYLLDLGVVPDIQGWKSLRLLGIWTPVESCLMKTPGEKLPVLTIAPMDTLSMDGRLTLKVQLQPGMIIRDKSSQAPNWLRLSPQQQDSNGSGSPDDLEPQDTEMPGQINRGPSSQAEQQASVQGQPIIDTNITDVGYTVNAEGLVSIEPSETDIQHLRSHRSNPTAVWVSSTLAAHAASQDVLMAYRIPESILNFSHSSSVPSGVMVLLGLADGPEGLQGKNRPKYGVNVASSQSRKRQPFAPAADQTPLTKVEADNVVQQLGDSRRAKRDQREAHMAQALQSRPWDARLVAQHSLRWRNARADQALALEETVAWIIRRMIRDEQLTASLGSMLSLWKSWSERGGMGTSDVRVLQEGVEALRGVCLRRVASRFD